WSPPVRRSAAQALGAVGAGAGHAIPSLLGLLADYDDGARASAVAALGGVGTATVPLLVQVLEERDLGRAGERVCFREEVERLWRRLEAEGAHRVPDKAWRHLAWA